MAKKIVLVITHGSNSDKSSVGMTIANAAKSGGHEVPVFLTSHALYLGKQAYADASVYRPLKPLEELVRTFLDGKGTVWACTPCVAHRGISPEDMLPGVIVTGAGPLIEWIDAGAQTICL
jgi:predicted peroxiredoxin